MPHGHVVDQVFPSSPVPVANKKDDGTIMVISKPKGGVAEHGTNHTPETGKVETGEAEPERRSRDAGAL